MTRQGNASFADAESRRELRLLERPRGSEGGLDNSGCKKKGAGMQDGASFLVWPGVCAQIACHHRLRGTKQGTSVAQPFRGRFRSHSTHGALSSIQSSLPALLHPVQSPIKTILLLGALEDDIPLSTPMLGRNELSKKVLFTAQGIMCLDSRSSLPAANPILTYPANHTLWTSRIRRPLWPRWELASPSRQRPSPCGRYVAKRVYSVHTETQSLITPFFPLTTRTLLKICSQASRFNTNCGK